MYTVCAWCNKRMKNDERPPYGLVTHGICQECNDKVVKELEVSRLEAVWRLS